MKLETIRDMSQIGKKNSIAISVFGYENKEKYLCIKKNAAKKNMVALIGKQGKRHCVPIKDFNTFIYDHILHRGRKHFSRY